MIRTGLSGTARGLVCLVSVQDVSGLEVRRQSGTEWKNVDAPGDVQKNKQKIRNGDRSEEDIKRSRLEEKKMPAQG